MAALLFANRHLLLASLPALVVGIAIIGATTWARASAPLAMMATSVAIAVEVGLVDEPRVRTFGFGMIIVLGLIAVMMSSQRWMFHMPDYELSVIVDSTRLRQILGNLLTNARRYGGSRVAVGAGSENERVWIEIRDNGLGVEPADESRIFLPYETAHQRAGVTASVGLGLAVAQQLAHLIHGESSYERRHRLTVFRLDFPEARAEQAQLL